MRVALLLMVAVGAASGLRVSPLAPRAIPATRQPVVTPTMCEPPTETPTITRQGLWGTGEAPECC